MSVLLLKTLRSTTFRLALTAIAIFGIVVIALFGYVYHAATSFVLGSVDRALDAEHAFLSESYGSGGNAAVAERIRQHLAEDRSDDDFYLLADQSYAIVAGNLAAWPPVLKNAGNTREASITAEKDGSERKQFLLRARAGTLPDGLHVLVGKNIDDLALFTRQIDAALIASVTFIFILAIAAGVAVTRRTVGRIEAINTASRSIMDSGLGQRMPLRGTQDEWDHLAQNLNSMLERIESLMAEVKQVSDNVAHDLRTPLTRMRGRLEKASIGARDPECDRSLIHETIADLDDVLRIFASLTRISQIESAIRKAAFRTVDLSEVAGQVAELFDAAAEDREMHLYVANSEPVHVTADRDLLFDAMANLVDNAIKHGRRNGHVIVGIERNADSVLVYVADNGPGIPAQERPHVFKRFYRLEESRGTPGNGLGLSLVAAVARLHGAQIELVDTNPGLKVELRFPAVESIAVKQEFESASPRARG